MSDVRDSRRAYYKAAAAAAIKKIVKTVQFEGAPAQAALSTNLTGTNNDLDFEAQAYGAAGNDVSVGYQAPAAADDALAVEVDGNAITVKLGTDGGTNEVQTLTIVATGGSFVLGFKSQSTMPIAVGATAARVEEALEGLNTIGTGNVTVTGSDGGPYTIEFTGALAGQNVPTLALDTNRLLPQNPRVDVQETTKGDDSPATNEVQRIALINGAVGTFTLTFDGETTSALAYNISAANMQTALRALTSIGASNVNVTKSGDIWTVTFVSALAAADQPMIEGDASGLRSGLVEVATPGVAYATDTTSQDILDAIEADEAAAALVNVAHKSANNGTGVVTAMAQTNLAGGKDGVGSISDAAAVTINPAGDNNSLVWTAKEAGLNGNGIRIQYLDPGADAAALEITYDEDERIISVSLATDADDAATTTLTSDATNVTEDEVVVIGAVTYRFRDTLAQVNDVQIGANAAGTLANLKATINLTGTEGVEYFAGQAIHPTVAGGAIDATTLALAAKTAGAAGNSLASTTTAAHLSFPAGTFANGDDGGEITTTADEIKTEVGLVAEVDALVAVADAGGNDGSGVVTAMPIAETSGGGGESSSGIACFIAHGDVYAAGNLQSAESVAGASGTLKLGTTSDDDNLVPSVTATDLAAGKVADKSGVVATLTAASQTPHQLILDGQTVYLKPGTADLTDGTLHVAVFYQESSAGGRLALVE